LNLQYDMFKSPVDTTIARTVTAVTIEIPSDHSLRYPGYSINGVSLLAATLQPVVIPVRSYIKVVEEPGFTWIEVEPLLISNQEMAKKLGVFPQLYFRLSGTGLDFKEGLVEQDFPLGNMMGFSFGIQFSDRIERDIFQSVSMILTAMEGIVADTSSWTGFSSLLQGLDDILLLDADGSRFTSMKKLLFVSGGTPEEIDYIPGTTRLIDRINNREGTLSIVSNDPDPATNFLWVNKGNSGSVVVSYGSANITADTHSLQVSHLVEWFAPQYITDPDHQLPRFTKGNRVTTYVNGPEYYNDLFKELNNAANAEGKFLLAGYSVYQDNELVTSGEDIPKTLLEAAQKIVDAQGQCYFLPLQLFQLKQEGQAVAPSDVLRIGIIVALLLADIGIIIFLNDKDHPNKTAIISAVVLAGAATAMILAEEIVEAGFVVDFIQTRASEADKLAFDNGIGKSRRIWAKHPATWEDNSYQGDSSGVLIMSLAKGLLPGVNAYHQKIAVVKTAADRWVSYCGGIDVNPNRMDDDRHRAASPYHDVHAKIEGPAARDLAITIIDRWNDEAPGDQVANADADLPSITPFPSGTDIVQVARTNFQANPNSDRSFSYATDGDRTILDTLLLTIRRAREYIYIEDQYFTPTPEYQQALKDALENGLKSLVIIMPSDPAQPFSETVRNPFIDRLLEDYNTETNKRVRIGYGRRRYALPSTKSEVLTGRLMLGEDLSDDVDGVMLRLGPVSRVPAFPFWVSVDGEIMLITGLAPTGPDEPGVEEIPGTDNTYKTYNKYNAERGDANNFFDDEVGYKPRKHRAGTPVTVVNFDSIYIHAKCMMIDDMFASIGSANMNRRGFHSDAEANIFFIPDSLRFDPQNPVAALRKRLWAEFLDIPGAMGNTLLEDPIAASKLFDRDSSLGNRFIPLRAISTKVKSYVNVIGDISVNTASFSGLETLKNTLSALAISMEVINFDEAYFYLTDPSSFTQNPPEP